MSPRRGSRAATGPIAVVSLVAVSVCLAAVVAGATALALPQPAEPVGVTADASAGGRVALTLTAGGPLDARRLGVRIGVDGRPLADQPPVPFFAASGFKGGPTGPFNRNADPRWSVGETASVRVARTNAPFPERGDTVTVELFVEKQRIAVARVRVG
ncbi:type IV pilin [Halocalculus aciditolerans]|uniref:Type IV pilin n=1 Tax=Halocalculus aciditolerans TaxID=1383812 RepID=A0A830FF64_9EURY|nr:type IV pilin [Halocalculus aciditolerans]GGL49128.1 hypothetical protein GCM10009039_04150 [Halocalculus aciditolerans]